MSSRLGLLAVSLAFAVASACGAGIAVLGGAASCGIPAASPALPSPPALHTAHADWDAGQVGNAAAIIAVGADLDVPNRGWVIAVATAMQESTLTNTPAATATPSACSNNAPAKAGATRSSYSTPSMPPASSTTACWPSPAGRPCRSPTPPKPSSTAPPRRPTPNGRPTPPPSLPPL